MAEQPKSDIKKVSKKKKRELASKLEKRPTAEQIGFDKKLAPGLQATAKKLQTEQKKDIVDQNLKTRPPPNEAGVDTTVAPAIQLTMKTLSNKIRRDSIKQSLQARPDIQELIDSGVLKPYTSKLANSLQLDAAKLEEALAGQVSKEYLKEIGILDPYKKNVNSEHIDIEKVSGLLLRALMKKPQISAKKIKEQTTAFGFADIAPTLQQTAHTLEVQQKKDKLSHALENRPTPRGLMKKQAGELGYDTRAAPSLQQTIKDLGREMIKDLLEKALRERPSADSIQCIEHGVDIKNAPAIQSAMHDLASAQRRDSISKGIKNRPSAKEAGIDTQLARGLQGIAKSLEMEMKSDTVKHKLVDLGIIKKPNTQSVVAKLDQCIHFIANYKF